MKIVCVNDFLAGGNGTRIPELNEGDVYETDADLSSVARDSMISIKGKRGYFFAYRFKPWEQE